MTVLQTFFNALGAYAFAKRKFPGRDVIFMVFLVTMMVPGQVTLIPNYIIIQAHPVLRRQRLAWATAGTAGWTPTGV